MNNNEHAEVAARYRISECLLFSPGEEHFFATLLCTTREQFIRSFAQCPDLVTSVAGQLREQGIEPRMVERKDGERRFDYRSFAKVAYPCADTPTQRNQDAFVAYAYTHPGGLQELLRECKRSEALLNGVHEPREDYFLFRDLFIDHNKRLALHVAKYWRNSHRAASYGLDELMHLAVLGVSNAADRYDINRGLRFSTFAMGQAQGAILHVIYPRREAEREHQWHTQSLSDMTLHEMPRAYDPEAAAREHTEQFAALAQVIDGVTVSGRPARDILYPLCGIGEERRLTLNELGVRLGVSRERVRQLRQIALKQVRVSAGAREQGKE